MELLQISPKKLQIKKLNNSDVIRAVFFEQQQYKFKKNNKKQPQITIIANILAAKIAVIYRKLDEKIIRKDKIKKKICEIYKFRQSLMKFSRPRRHESTFLNKIEKYQQLMTLPFDVCRKLLTSKRKKKVVRKEREKNLQADITDEDNNEFQFSSGDDDKTDFNYEPTGHRSWSTKKRDLSEIVEAQCRFGASVRCTSAIVNATLRTFEIPEIIDKSKLSRAQKRKFTEIDQDSISFGGGIYYDGRKDLSMNQTKKQVENGKYKYYRHLKREEHISIVSQPEGLFLGSVATKKGNAKLASQSIISFVENQNILNLLMVLGCDGTNTNVGSDGGINQYIEEEVGRPLHWFICMLHLNELPLKRLIIELDGPKSGKKTFSGPVGSALVDVSSSAIVNYKRFDMCENLPVIPEHVFNKLSNDQKYLYNIVSALISGRFPESLRQMKVGEMNHSRWLTIASRICKLYALTGKPSDTLKTLTFYIVNVYAPTWFQIKKHELAVDGPKNLYYLIKRSHLITDESVKKIVHERIQWNAYFAHSENLLLAQLSSNKKSERLDAVLKILKIRENSPNGGVRRFKVPVINFGAKKWIHMINYNLDSTEPPFTIGMNEKELIDIIEQKLEVPKFKCHTQMVERAVKEVTRVSLKAIDHNKRNSMVKATLIHRAKYPKLDSAKDHIINNSEENPLPKI